MTRATLPEDSSIEEILDTIGDELSRRVLVAISHEPRSAPELAADLSCARSTIYERLDTLEEYDLVTSEISIAKDGNHFKVFMCNFKCTVISLENDVYDVRIYREKNLPDRFSRLWDDLGRKNA